MKSIGDEIIVDQQIMDIYVFNDQGQPERPTMVTTKDVNTGMIIDAKEILGGKTVDITVEDQKE